MLLNEIVNAKGFVKGFEKTKEILGGKYKLVAKNGYIALSKPQTNISHQFRIEALTPKGTLIGWVNFEKVEDHLEALDLVVDKKHRQKGIATQMYVFAKELGNTIKASDKQTTMGKLFWTKDHS